MAKQWDVIVNGKNHTVALKRKLSYMAIVVDGQEIPFQSQSLKDFVGWDRMITIDGKELYVSWHGFVPKLAVDGFYLGTDKPYRPLSDIPKWAYIFIVLCAAMLLISIGFIPIMLVYVGIIYNLKIAVSSLRTPAKIAFTSLLTLVLWGELFLVIIYH